jgi:hypothetical protein
VQGPGAQHELPALGRGDRGDNRHLAAELVGRPGLAFADALYLGGVQRVDFGLALALLVNRRSILTRIGVGPSGRTGSGCRSDRLPGVFDPRIAWG